MSTTTAKGAAYAAIERVEQKPIGQWSEDERRLVRALRRLLSESRNHTDGSQ
jgi:hypothetical protein